MAIAFDLLDPDRVDLDRGDAPLTRATARSIRGLSRSPLRLEPA